jgi:O-antigen ligase
LTASPPSSASSLPKGGGRRELLQSRTALEDPGSRLEFGGHFLWIAAILIAPFWFGGVKPEAQAFCSILIGISLLLCGQGRQGSKWEAILFAGTAVLLIAAVLPLPAGFVEAISPNRAVLAREFPIEKDRAGLLSLAIAPGAAINRFWQLAMIASVFLLARKGAKERRVWRSLPLLIATGVVLLSLTEIWFLWEGHGIWKVVRNYPAGTFASRNHYADWMSMGTLFCMGALARRRDGGELNSFGWREMLLGLAIILGIGTIVACGSRGGSLALTVGFAVFACLAVRQKAKWLAAGGVVVLVAAFLLFGGLLRHRLGQAALGFKLQIWRDAWAFFCSFPVFGTGLGGFETAFNHYKTFHGTGTFLHAENEYIQWLVETGTIGFFLGFGLLGLLATRVVKLYKVRRERDGLLLAGCLAGVAGFAAHALVEFVFQVPATALLVAVLLGLLLGTSDKRQDAIVPSSEPRTRLLSRIGLGLALLCIGSFQALAAIEWHKGKSAHEPQLEIEHLERATGYWPFNSRRALELTRVYENAGGLADGHNLRLARETLNRALAWDPYNWELRLERAWVDLVAPETEARGIAEAKETQRLNPLQPRISLEFAKYFALPNPEVAFQFLRETPATDSSTINETLKLGREISPSPAVLWELTPATPAGFLALGDFAMEQQLLKIASEAYRKAKGAEPELKLAEKLLRVGDADGALEILKEASPSTQKEILLERARVRALQ